MRRRFKPRFGVTDDEMRAGFQELVERQMLVVVKYDPDPLESEYAVSGKKGAEQMVAKLAALGIRTF